MSTGWEFFGRLAVVAGLAGLLGVVGRLIKARMKRQQEPRGEWKKPRR